MKTLYLVRHAKSDWGNESLTDIDRPLNARGYADAHKMSKLLKEKNEIPDVVFTSTAIRALSTAVIFARNLELSPKAIKMKANIYEASAAQLFRILHRINECYHTVLLIAHNPGITAAVNMLCLEKIENIPTTGMACMDVNIERWEELAAGTGRLRYFDFPKNHP